MSYYRSNSRTSRTGPPMVVADQPNGCESTACYIAQTFYNCCVNEITKINSRNKLRDFYIKSQRFWMPPQLTDRGETRHFDQVLYALVNDGGVCRVKKTEDGSHRVTWGINHFQRPRTHPRKRINAPQSVQPISLSDLEEGRGSPLTMSDLGSIQPVMEEGEVGFDTPPLHRETTEDYAINMVPLHRTDTQYLDGSSNGMRLQFSNEDVDKYWQNPPDSSGMEPVYYERC